MSFLNKHYYPPVNFWTVWFSEAMLFYFKKNNRILKSDDVVADIGCGLGYHSVSIAKKGVQEVYGFDISKDTMDVLKGFDTPVKFEAVDIVNSDIGDYISKFSVIFSSDVYEHVSSPQIMINNIHRMLSDNGVVCITFPNWIHHGQNQFDNIDVLRNQLTSSGFRNFNMEIIEEYSLVFRFFMKLYIVAQRVSDILLGVKRVKGETGGMPESNEFQEMYAFKKINKIKKYKLLIVILNLIYDSVKKITRITKPYISSNDLNIVKNKRIIFFAVK